MDAVAYWDPKVGTELAEWEDGAAFDRSTGWFSVADGASTGAASREWAHALTSSFVRQRSADIFRAGEAGARQYARWIAAARLEFERLRSTAPEADVPGWVRDASRREGAYATVLGGWLDGTALRMLAIGDCCAFVLRAGDVVFSFPLESASEFGSSPDLVASADGVDPGAAACRRTGVRLDPGDEVVVATDALAEYLVSRRDDRSAWEAVMSLSWEGFRDLTHDLRLERVMKNDDITMLRCRPRTASTARGGT